MQSVIRTQAADRSQTYHPSNGNYQCLGHQKRKTFFLSFRYIILYLDHYRYYLRGFAVVSYRSAAWHLKGGDAGARALDAYDTMAMFGPRESWGCFLLTMWASYNCLPPPPPAAVRCCCRCYHTGEGSFIKYTAVLENAPWSRASPSYPRNHTSCMSVIYVTIAREHQMNWRGAGREGGREGGGDFFFLFSNKRLVMGGGGMNE